MSGPPRALPSTSGSISARATSPALSALPVVLSTKNGSAIIETWVPVIETASEASQRRADASRATADPPRQRERVQRDDERLGLVVRHVLLDCLDRP